jgi:hypothetical protein
MHIDEEKEQGRYLYPDSVVCASVWFDFRGEIDSLYVLSWPIALYEDEFANPEVHFLGFIENNNLLIGIASLGEENPQTISSFVDTYCSADKQRAIQIRLRRVHVPSTESGCLLISNFFLLHQFFWTACACSYVASLVKE